MNPACLAVLFLSVFLITPSLGIKCYRCTGTDDDDPFQCNEWLDSDIDIVPKGCDDVYDAKYCIKHTGRFEADAIKCFQCSAGQSINCSDGMIQLGGLVPEGCDQVFEAQYCVKSTGLAGGIGAKRFCSSLDLGNYCNYVKQPGDNLEFYRTCVFTCSGDGCNASSTLQSVPAFVLLLFAAVLYTAISR
ncbi:PREDICTED: uncharacterized protein LOC108564463 [Nicrophorus vespilloides]|uniref:Uncharacterized protein LOC108564463 n=1 Tax=Nicrophorus vespilloides TaxID=110193 RepID=A0ABM1MWR0_NICVS|nr:PREDICTED: uncharacterized protein LOC108564463 [Nicrophorus vespilloides]